MTAHESQDAATNHHTQQLVCLLSANQKIFFKLELNAHLNEHFFFSENVIGLDESIISEQFTLSSFSDCAKGAKDALVCTAETLRFAVAVCTCTTGTFTAAVLYIQT